MTTKNALQFHRYGYIAKGRKYWSIGLGDPFMMSWYEVPIIGNEDRDALIKSCIKALKSAKKKWKNKYPHIEW